MNRREQWKRNKAEGWCFFEGWDVPRLCLLMKDVEVCYFILTPLSFLLVGLI